MRIEYNQIRTSPFSKNSETKSKEITKTTSDHLDTRITKQTFNFNSINEITKRNYQESIPGLTNPNPGSKASFLQGLDNSYSTTKHSLSNVNNTQPQNKKSVSIRSDYLILLQLYNFP